MNRLFWLFVVGLSVLASCSLVREENISGEQVQALSPADLDTLESGNVSFWWDWVVDATDYEFQLVSPSFLEVDSLLVDSLATENVLNFQLETGQYAWRVRALNASYATDFVERIFWISDGDDISDMEISILAPESLDTLNSGVLQLLWQLVDGASEYHVQLVSPSFSGIERQWADTLVSSNTLSLNLDAGAYEFRVSGANAEYNTDYAYRSFWVLPGVNISDQSIVLLAPSEMDTVNSTLVQFWWESVDAATEYEFQLVSPSFDDIEGLVTDQIITENLISMEALTTGQYEFRVRAKNESYATDFYNRTFWVDLPIDISSEAVNLLSPSEMDTLRPGDISFWWDEVKGAKNYEFQLVSSSFDQLESIVTDSLATTNLIELPLDSGKYEYRVRALNDEYSTDFEYRVFWILPED